MLTPRTLRIQTFSWSICATAPGTLCIQICSWKRFDVQYFSILFMVPGPKYPVLAFERTENKEFSSVIRIAGRITHFVFDYTAPEARSYKYRGRKRI